MFGKRIAAYDRTFPRRPFRPHKKGLVHVIGHVRNALVRKFKGK